MQTAGYFRDQAALCLEIALDISDPRAAEDLRDRRPTLRLSWRRRRNSSDYPPQFLSDTRSI
jgi:hypothetical protein